jgi:hypothetical protein
MLSRRFLQPVTVSDRGVYQARKITEPKVNEFWKKNKCDWHRPPGGLTFVCGEKETILTVARRTGSWETANSLEIEC